MGAQFHYHLVTLRYAIKAAPILMMAHELVRSLRKRRNLVLFGLLFSAIGDLCLITSKLDSDSVQTITSGQMLVLASGILAFGIAQTLYVLAFGFQSRNMHTLDLGAFILSAIMSSLQNTP